ncbi:type II toxin-antitoxin system RelE/ParE family toxin [Methylobacterium oryzisoli]|uniref:type II toxin-antitoxin system RelE/ParE family toxin n=1 Tax=Methylobacterium oryzisoli TaxID=3385502 RepID=UPI003891DBDA
MITSFRSKALKRFWTRSDARGLRPDWVGRIERQLDLLDRAERPEDMDIVTYGFHALIRDPDDQFGSRIRQPARRLSEAEIRIAKRSIGFRMTGDRAGRYAVTVSRNWRLTFAFDGRDAVDVDLEDYHGG